MGVCTLQLPKPSGYHTGSFQCIGTGERLRKQNHDIYTTCYCDPYFYRNDHIEQVSHIYNYPSNITATNALRRYTYTTKIIRHLKCAIVLIFSIITLFTYLTAMGRSNGLGYWFLPFMLALIFLPTVYYVVNSFKDIR